VCFGKVLYKEIYCVDIKKIGQVCFPDQFVIVIIYVAPRMDIIGFFLGNSMKLNVSGNEHTCDWL